METRLRIRVLLVDRVCPSLTWSQADALRQRRCLGFISQHLLKNQHKGKRDGEGRRRKGQKAMCVEVVGYGSLNGP